MHQLDPTAMRMVAFSARDQHEGKRLVGYLLGGSFWGRGIASRALCLFLAPVARRPLRAFVARHSAGSIRVLEKCGVLLAGDGSHDVDDELMFTLPT